jgi:hypothetical protein
MMTRQIRPLTVAAFTSAVLVLARPALAGPPLLCFPFDIGSARSLPMGHSGWHDTDPKYDVSRLVDDTLALLTPAASLNLRMETLRRAAVYASTQPQVAQALVKALEERSNAKAPLAAFDHGYLVEALREAAALTPARDAPGAK